MGSTKFRPQLMFVPSDGTVDLDFGRECELKAVPSRYDLNLSQNEGKVLEVTVGSLLNEPMSLNVRILALGSLVIDGFVIRGAPFIAEIIQITLPTPRSYPRHKAWGLLHGDYNQDRSTSACWLPRGFDYEAYAEGDVSARDPQFGGIHWMRLS